MKLLSHSPESEPALKLDNTVDAQSVSFEDAHVIELNFPKFTDGRAYSQAHVLRRRGFAGDLRATGEVLVDQLAQLRRCGFTSVVLRADQSLQTAQRLLDIELPAYQGDAVRPQPHFSRSHVA